MCFSILIFSSAGLSLHTLTPLLFAYMQSNQGWTKCCAILNFMSRTTDMHYATSSTANFFSFFLYCLVGANWEMRESALAHLPWLPSIFLVLQERRFHFTCRTVTFLWVVCEKVERGFRYSCSSLHAISVTNCLGRLIPRRYRQHRPALRLTLSSKCALTWHSKGQSH